jgi:hypothetical protein
MDIRVKTYGKSLVTQLNSILIENNYTSLFEKSTESVYVMLKPEAEDPA